MASTSAVIVVPGKASSLPAQATALDCALGVIGPGGRPAAALSEGDTTTGQREAS
jgi:hypothetical protein